MGVFIILIRFYLLFPAAAIDQRLKFGEAWRRAHGNTWRLIGALFFTNFIISLPLILLTTFLGESVREAASGIARIIVPGGTVVLDPTLLAYLFLLSVIWVLKTVVLVTILSKFYLHIIGAPQREAADASRS